MANLVNVLAGLVAAVIVFIALTALISFQHSRLLFGLLAALVFVAVASGRLHLHP